MAHLHVWRYQVVSQAIVHVPTHKEQYFKSRLLFVCLCLYVTVPKLSAFTYLYRSTLHYLSYTQAWPHDWLGRGENR